MITLYNHENGKSFQVEPTIFPDGTSQCWKLPEYIMSGVRITLKWDFEQERELIDVCNLLALFEGKKSVELLIPYLPYARQDKEISNESTFALRTFANILNSFNFSNVISHDVHSSEAFQLINNFTNIAPDFTVLLEKTKPTYLVAPDKGARLRYPVFDLFLTITFEKYRNQETGEIVGIDADLSDIKSGDKFLIIDDLIDGGKTFIEISKKLHSVKENIGVDLYCTHGLFSKGIAPLYRAGINEIYTTNSRKQKYSEINVIEV